MDSLTLKEAYKILKLGTTASKEEVKSAYRAQVKLIHPDRNPSPTAHEDFVELTEAYELIKSSLDPKQKTKHDPLKAREEARRRAEHYAKMRYENFVKSDYYQDLLAIETVGKIIILLLAAAIMILIPVMSLLFEGKRAFFSSLILTVVISPILIIYRHELSISNVRQALTRIIKLRASWYIMIFLFNTIIFFKIGLTTLITPSVLIMLYFIAPGILYLLSHYILKLSKFSLIKHYLLIPLAVSLFLVINYSFSIEISSEQHFYVKPVTSTLLIFENNSYQQYPGVRLFLEMNDIARNDGLEFTLERGLFKLPVVKNYKFIKKQ